MDNNTHTPVSHTPHVNYYNSTHTTPQSTPTQTLRFGQINLGKSKAATATLSQTINTLNLDIILTQEPYTINNKTAGFPLRFPIAEKGEERPKANIIIPNPDITYHYHADISTNNIAVVTLLQNTHNTTIISAYTEPDSDIHAFLDTLTDIITHTNNKHIIIGTDINAHSMLWGGTRTSRRGWAVEDWLASNNTTILNTGDTATFDNIRHNSIIDITISDYITQQHITDWTVLDTYTASDHKLITFTYNTTTSTTPLSTRKYRTTKVDWTSFHNSLNLNFIQHNINIDTLHKITDNKTLDNFVTTFMNTITNTCNSTLLKNKHKHKHTPNPWWTTELTILRNKVTAIKRRHDRTHTPELQLIRKQHYNALHRRYKTLIQQEKEKSWRSFCQIDTRQPFSCAYKLCRQQFTRKHIQRPLKDNNNINFTNTTLESQHILNTFFGQTQVQDTDQHNTTNDNQPTYQHDTPLTTHEIDNIVSQIKDKSPGPDGLDHIIVNQIHKHFHILLTDIYKTIYTKQLFPSAWKHAHLTLIPKPHKTHDTADSYRPICLLPIIGKIYETLLNNRLTYHLYNKQLIHRHQYGFIRTKTTAQPTQILVNAATEAFKTRSYCVAITLDIHGAFNNVLHTHILNSLNTLKIPSNLTNIIHDFLHNRHIHLQWKNTNTTHMPQKGCPQGSSLSPTLWVSNINTLLTEHNPTNTKILVFADDILITATDNDIHTLERNINSTLTYIHQWVTQQSLQFNYKKCTGTLFTRKHKYMKPTFKLNTHIIPMHTNIKYLGLTIDHKLTWHQHIINVTNKCRTLIHQLYRIAHNTWGCPKNTMSIIHKQVLTPMITYNCHIWSNAITYKHNTRLLHSTERQMALRVVKGYRSISYEAAMALANFVPWTLEIQRQTTLQNILSNDTYKPHRTTYKLEQKTSNDKIPHPDNQTLTLHHKTHNAQSTLHIFTDGSKTPDGVGAGLCAYEKSDNNTTIQTYTKTFHLHKHNSVYQAELYAILQAVRLVDTLELSHTTCTIYTDSLSALQDITHRNINNYITNKIIRTYQNIRNRQTIITIDWVKAHVGIVGNSIADDLAKAGTHSTHNTDYNRIPKSYIKTLTKTTCTRQYKQWYNNININNRIKTLFNTFQQLHHYTNTNTTNFYTTQIITGHGSFNTYLHKRTISRTPTCTCNNTTLQDPEHLLLHCTNHTQKRIPLTRHLQQTRTPNTLQAILNSTPTHINILTTLMKDIITEHN